MTEVGSEREAFSLVPEEDADPEEQPDEDPEEDEETKEGSTVDTK